MKPIFTNLSQRNQPEQCAGATHNQSEASTLSSSPVWSRCCKTEFCSLMTIDVAGMDEGLSSLLEHLVGCPPGSLSSVTCVIRCRSNNEGSAEGSRGHDPETIRSANVAVERRHTLRRKAPPSHHVNSNQKKGKSHLPLYSSPYRGTKALKS